MCAYSLYFKYTYMYIHSLKKYLEKQEKGILKYMMILKDMDSSSVKPDYTEAFELISSVSLCRGGHGAVNGNTVCEQLRTLPAINRRSVAII